MPFIYDKSIIKNLNNLEAKKMNKGWGLFSVPLGNSDNVFYTFKFLLKGNSDLDIPSLKEELEKSPKFQWNQTRKEFINSLNAVKNQKNKLKNFLKLQKDLKNITNVSDSKINEYNQNLKEKNIKTILLNEALKNIENLKLEKTNLPKKYNFLKCFFFKKKKKINIEIDKKNISLTEKINSLKLVILDHKNRVAILDSNINTYLDNQKQKQEIIQTLQLESKHFKNFEWNSEQYFEYDEKEKHFKSLFFEENLAELRTKCFLSALKLHKSFQQNCREELIENIKKLKLFFDNKLKNKSDFNETDLLALFSSLQIFFPVISTALASFYKMFDKLENESIRYVIIDEAAQAMPHNAIGALRKSKNFITIGDPMQINPIIKPSDNLIKEVGKLFEVETPYLNDEEIDASIQKVVEMVTKYGTFARTREKNKIRIGIPLLVHRRCANPMFTISNKLAYENKMHLHNSLVDKEKHNLNSVWLNESSFVLKNNNANKVSHLVPNQIDLVNEIIKLIKNNENLKSKEISIITPFKDIYNALKSHNIISKYPKLKIGTNFKFQGKESNIVIFILGCDKTTRGSIKWYVKEPNNLNVTVTRAKETIIFIGSHEFMEDNENLKVVYDSLNKYNIQEYLKIIERY